MALGSIGGFGSVSPESGNVWDDREKIVQTTWSSPATSKLLLEAGLSSFNSRWGGQIPAGALTGLIPVTETECGGGRADCELHLPRMEFGGVQRSAA